ncbi:hypothetical protein SAMN05216567_103610 [Variovorax sp. OK605]|uniref:hypothetical protein n=1 Tax=Variovorax sp. OK605 TaxID=1855317 RepID=UPI0008E04016|nr:hypothetical protein [Variovorax sp. OK605]SFO98833.1 hypothetical protein SAMN05216567_103610 [Variovorax sp. OK605]
MSALALLLLLQFQPAAADEVATHCAGRPSISGTDLLLASCRTKGGMAIERNLGPKPSSPYATALDQRELVVAHGSAPADAKAATADDADPHAARAPSRLLAPPLEDQISRRTSAGTARRYGHWRVSTLRVEYGVQDASPGFFLSCATATRTSEKRTAAKAATIVAECFAPQEHPRFYKTLDSTR